MFQRMRMKPLLNAKRDELQAVLDGLDRRGREEDAR